MQTDVELLREFANDGRPISGASSDFERIADRSETLEATDAKLPKTADGVSVVPEDEVWRKWPNIAPECESVRKHQVKAVCADGAYLYCVVHGDGYRETPIPLAELFSTREAAEKAKEPPA